MDKPMTANIWLSRFGYDLNEFPVAGQIPPKLMKNFKPMNLQRKFLVYNVEKSHNYNYIIVWFLEFKFQEKKTAITFIFLMLGRKLDYVLL